jgi:hypothetical protein
MSAVNLTVNLPGDWLVIKDKCEDASLLQAHRSNSSLFQQLQQSAGAALADKLRGVQMFNAVTATSWLCPTL